MFVDDPMGNYDRRWRIASLVIFTSFEIRFVPRMQGVHGEADPERNDLSDATRPALLHCGRCAGEMLII